ncbi:MAG: LAGLIDADG family homing endonuclease, partial [Methanosarcinales archaeon]
MIEINSQRFNFLVTPNHRMIFRGKTDDRFEYIEAKDLKNRNGYLPVTFGWNGKDSDTFNIYNFIPKNKEVRVREHSYKYGGKKVLVPEHIRTCSGEGLEPFNTDNFLKLMGWFLSEGSIFRMKGKSTCYVQIRNSSHKEEIKELLDRMGLNYGFYEGSRFVIFHRDLARYFKKCCGNYCYNKKIPKEVLELSREHLKNLFETIWKGDGSDNQVYYTTSKELADTVLILCLKLGLHANIGSRGRNKGGRIKGRKINSTRKIFCVHVQYEAKGSFNQNQDSFNEKEYDGKVWCFKTKSDNFFTVRNGKVGLSGNSGKTLALTYLAWNNWYRKQRRIFANLDLFGFPFTKITSIPELDRMQEGFFAGDELWLWVDCIHPDTFIVTNPDIIKAEEVSNNEFLSLNLKNGNVTKSWSSGQLKRFVKPKEKLLKISTRTRSIIVSKNHRFFAINRDPNFWNRHENDNPLDFVKEQKAKTLRKGDRVLLVHKLPEPKEELIKSKLAQLLGYIMADGNIEHPHRWAMYIDDESKKCLEEYRELAKGLGFSTSLHKHRGVNCYRLRLYKKEKIQEVMDICRDVVKPLGLTSKISNIPEKIIKSNNKVLGAFLSGFFDGEAYPKIEESLQEKFGKIICVKK